jgi:WAS/WASL-interacting protein
MIALSTGARGADQPVGKTIAVEAMPGAGLFEVASNDGETFAQAVAALAASLPMLADAPNEPVEATPEPESGEGAPAPVAETAPSDAALLPADEAHQTATETGNPDNDTAPPQLASVDVSLSEAVLNQAFSDDHFASANFSGAAPAREETETVQVLSEEPPSEAVPPAQNFSTEPVPGPQEDPADLFESVPVPTPPVETAASVTADAAVPAEPTVEPPRAVPPPPARAIPRPPGSDPLAAVRDLSEEELIALFS